MQPSATVELEYHGEGADVRIAGSWTDWEPVMMTRHDDGRWSYITRLEPGSRVQFKFVVDGSWRSVDNYDLTDDGHGAKNNTLYISRPPPFAPPPKSPMDGVSDVSYISLPDDPALDVPEASPSEQISPSPATPPSLTPEPEDPVQELVDTVPVLPMDVVDAPEQTSELAPANAAPVDSSGTASGEDAGEEYTDSAEVDDDDAPDALGGEEDNDEAYSEQDENADVGEVAGSECVAESGKSKSEEEEYSDAEEAAHPLAPVPPVGTKLDSVKPGMRQQNCVLM